MIRVELPWLVFLCLLFFLGTIFCFWIAQEFGRRSRERRKRRFRIRCRVCQFEYDETTGAPLPRCPQCGSLNEREPPRVF